MTYLHLLTQFKILLDINMAVDDKAQSVAQTDILLQDVVRLAMFSLMKYPTHQDFFCPKNLFKFALTTSTCYSSIFHGTVSVLGYQDQQDQQNQQDQQDQQNQQDQQDQQDQQHQQDQQDQQHQQIKTIVIG